MCDLVELKIGERNIKVASIKKDYIQNIIESVGICREIDKIILFGSALSEECTYHSDVDIAIFGKHTKQKIYRMKSYNDFIKAIVSFGEIQDYDLLYFDSTKKYEDPIMNDINKGEVLYERMWEDGVINEVSLISYVDSLQIEAVIPNFIRKNALIITDWYVLLKEKGMR